MAKIQKIELNLGHKIANPFKTTRKSSTNPFKYQDFEGNTLDVAAFADVFSGANKNTSKLKMISTSVIGSLTRLRNSITEPVVQFVNRVRDGITSAWTYAKNTNIEISGLKNITDSIHNVLSYDVGKGITDSLSGIGKNISGGMELLNRDITDIGHDLAGSWNTLISKIHTNKISSDMPVADLRALWIKENELTHNSIKEAA